MNLGAIDTGHNSSDGGTATASAGAGGPGAFGIYIQGYAITAGVINASGQAGVNGGGGSSGGGGNCAANDSGAGGRTTVAGGVVYISGSGWPTQQNGSTPTQPSMSNSTIQTWHANGFINYLTGGGGGGGRNWNVGGGQSGATNGRAYTSSYGGSGGSGGQTCSQTTDGGGGGGGGVVILAYGNGSQPSTSSISVNGNVGGGVGGTGGTGGKGQIIPYSWSSPPISP